MDSSLDSGQLETVGPCEWKLELWFWEFQIRLRLEDMMMDSLLDSGQLETLGPCEQNL